jgi:hypothetical protein
MHSFKGRELVDSSSYKIGNTETVFREDGPEFALKSDLFGAIRRLVPVNDVRERGDESGNEAEREARSPDRR